MNESFLKEKIYERAEKQTEKEYKEFLNVMLKNKFANKIEIKIGYENVPLACFGCNYALFNNDMLENERAKNTNLEEVYEEILENNIKNLTNDLLGKLENISYLFGGTYDE